MLETIQQIPINKHPTFTEKPPTKEKQPITTEKQPTTTEKQFSPPPSPSIKEIVIKTAKVAVISGLVGFVITSFVKAIYTPPLQTQMEDIYGSLKYWDFERRVKENPYVNYNNDPIFNFSNLSSGRNGFCYGNEISTINYDLSDCNGQDLNTRLQKAFNAIGQLAESQFKSTIFSYGIGVNRTVLNLTITGC